MRPIRIALLAAAPLWLAGCDLLGLESATQIAERREAEGKAIGGACRHAARSIEVCYELNRRAEKAAIFAGWREMNDYMRENKLEAMPAPEPDKVAAAAPAPIEGDDPGATTGAPQGKAATAAKNVAAGRAELAGAGSKSDPKSEPKADPKSGKPAANRTPRTPAP